jgi:hypothetical protein
VTIPYDSIDATIIHLFGVGIERVRAGEKGPSHNNNNNRGVLLRVVCEVEWRAVWKEREREGKKKNE